MSELTAYFIGYGIGSIIGGGLACLYILWRD